MPSKTKANNNNVVTKSTKQAHRSPSNNNANLTRTPSTHKPKNQIKQPQKNTNGNNKIQIVVTKDKKPKRQPSPPVNTRQSSPPIHASQSSHLILKASVQEPRGRRRSSSVVEIRRSTTIYAGPTFNNAPAPSSIPIPPALSPILVSIDLTKKGQQEEYLNLEKSSQDMMDQLSSAHPTNIHQQRYFHKSHSHHFYNRLHNHQQYHHDKDLSEIQRDLRSLLKI